MATEQTIPDYQGKSENRKKRRRIGKWVGRGFLVALAAAAIWIVANWNDLGDFVQTPAGAYAEFMATSLFVENRSLEEAEIFSRLPLPVGPVTIDYANKTVTVEAYFVKRTARYVDAKRGVTLE